MPSLYCCLSRLSVWHLDLDSQRLSSEEEVTKMNPAVKAKWLTALRSGKYKQGRAVLRSGGDEFCCLGVLCDLHDERGWQIHEGSFCYRVGVSENLELPPKSLAAEFGFDWEKVEVQIGPDVATLYDHNDSGRTFEQIANAIEEQL